MMFNDGEGVYNMVTEQERKPDCAVCSGKPVLFDCAASLTLSGLLEELKILPQFQLKDPSVTSVRPNGMPHTLYVK